MLYERIDLKKEEDTLFLKRILVMFLITCSPLINYAQLGESDVSASVFADFPNIIPPSPTVASLMKFEEIPVNNYTGIPDISIPIFSTETLSKDVVIDFSLKYHPSSIAPKEIASYTGLGWNLFAGGTISRTVRGFPDEVIYYGNKFSEARIGIYHNNLTDNYVNRYYEVLNYFGNPSPTQSEAIGNFIWGVTEKGILDSEHDLYQVNFMGHTARFIIKMNSTGVLQIVRLDNDNAIAIQLNYTYDDNEQINKYNFIGFTIYDDKGYKYIFDVKEQTTESKAIQNILFNDNTYDTFYSPFSYVSSYHLSKILDNVDNEIVSFSYQDSGETTTYFNIMENRPNPNTLENEIAFWQNNPTDYGTVYGILPKKVKTHTQISVVTKKLMQIAVTNKAKISFILESDRQDSNCTGDKLKTVVIYAWNSIGSELGPEIKRFVFNYGYLNTTPTSKRLILTELIEKSPTNQELKYTFAYKELITSDITTDYWGYLRNGGQSKDPHPTYGKSGILQKITLPTKGCIVFDFEANTYSHVGSQEVQGFDDIPENWEPPTYSTIYINSIGSNGFCTDYLLPVSTKKRKFKFSHTISPQTTNYTFQLGLFENNNFSLGVEYNPVTNEYTLDPNKQYVFRFCWFNIGQTGIATVYTETRERVNNPVQYLFGGGNRIKTIGYFDEDVNKDYYEGSMYQNGIIPAKQISYNYDFFGTSKSSGSLVFAKPVYQYNQVRSYFNECPSLSGPCYTLIGEIQYTTTTEFNSLQFLRTHGADVGYKNVTVSETSNLQNNGYSEYVYYSPIDYPETDYTITPPFIPSKNIDYKRGQIHKERHYKQKALFTSQLIQEVTYNYHDFTNYEGEVHTGIRSYPIFCPSAHKYFDYTSFKNCFSSPTACFPFAIYNVCNPNTYLSKVDIKEAYGWSRLQGKVTTNYFYEGNNSEVMNTTETFTYNDSNKKLEEHTITNSLGETLKTKYYYDTNHANRNRIGVIKKIETFRNGVLLETKEINYVNTFTGNSSYLPATISVSKGIAPSEVKIRYLKYDEYGNPLEVKQEGGVHIVYLWGYNKAYPIAKIENATYLQITGALGVSTISEANLGQINDLRNNPAFSNAMITTYTYEPLVGVSSITDPRGYTITYHYDDFGRLEFIKDSEGNILEENKYHYRTQN